MANIILTRTQKQAYEGAKAFYMCFLPVVIASVIILLLLYRPYQSVFNVMILLVSYLVAVKFYKLCNEMDPSLLRHRNHQNKSNEININANTQFTKSDQNSLKNEQKTVYDAQLNQTGIMIQQKSNNSQPTRHQQKPHKIYCNICNMLLPYRSRHCPKCQTCIQRYDHHCFWIGSCVGYKNHRQFYIFLMLQTINNLSMLCSLLSLHQQFPSQYPYTNIILYALQFCTVCFIIFTAYLWIYHTMLMVTGMTTWQHMARSKITYLKYLPSGVNPFTRGVCGNIRQFWIHSSSGSRVQYDVPSYEQAKLMKPSCNIIDNQYYSCC